MIPTSAFHSLALQIPVSQNKFFYLNQYLPIPAYTRRFQAFLK